jgi:hypothetical protein
MYAMPTAELQSTELMQAPKLRLTPKRCDGPGRAGADRPQLRLLSDPAPAEKPILLAGGDRYAREAVRHDLAKTMPPSTAFEQAGAIWEVLVRASEVSMVILSGELDDTPAESLMEMLAHRHPDLPVVSLDAPPCVDALAKVPATA